MKRLLGRYLPYFRMLNLLDWFIIVLIFAVALFLGVSSINRERWVTIEFKVTLAPAYAFGNADSPPSWIVDKIRPGDVQNDNLGARNLEVKSIRSWGWGYRQTWITASVKAKYNKNQKKYTFQYQPLEVGRAIDVTIDGTNIHGVVTSVEGSTTTRKMYDVFVDARLFGGSGDVRGVDAWIADSFSQGETMKDLSGAVIAEVVTKEVRPAERIITTSDGRVFMGTDPLRKDVYLKLRLRVSKDNDTFFFLEDYAIKVGVGIPLFLTNTQLGPIITHVDFPQPGK